MLTRSIRWGSLVLFVAASICVSQERPGGQEGKVQDDPANRRIKSKRRGRGPRPENLIKKLDLDEDQQVAVRKIFEDHDKQTRALQEEFRPSPEMSERLREIREEMRAARMAGDEAPMREIRERMRAVQEVRRQKMAPMRERREALRKAQYESLLEVMHEDQKASFEEFWAEMTEPRRFDSVQQSPRALKRVVDRLPDLTSEQKEQIEAMFNQHRLAARENPRGSPANTKLAEKLYTDVMKVLTPGQKEMIEARLNSRRGPGERRRDARRDKERRERPAKDRGRGDD